MNDERERERERGEQCWAVTRFDWLEPLAPVSKNWCGRFESLASVLVSKNRIRNQK